MEGNTINKVCRSKFVQVIIDDDSSWKSQVKHISTKVAKGMEIIIKAKPYINKKNIGGPLPCICLSVHNLLQYSLEKYLQYSA